MNKWVMIVLGLDIGSSSVKAALVDQSTNRVLASSHYPTTEMAISAPQPGWAEQEPDLWWNYSVQAIQKAIQKAGISGHDIERIGIAYQMHGLVMVDKDQKPIRPSIIWCDSRAVEMGKSLTHQLGLDYCGQHLLNSVGNFTAAKLAWVKAYEPQLFDRIHKIMLPGDYIAMKFCGEISTTLGGLSEGIFWDYKHHQVSQPLLDAIGVSTDLIPSIVPNFSNQGQVTETAAHETGLKAGTMITYRAGDQPNNALSLGVLEPGQIAATGGTSGVVFGVVDQLVYDFQNRVNTFAHVNHSQQDTRLGVLLCINGAGIQYSWVKNQLTQHSYDELEKLVEDVPVGSAGLRILPFGNGAERMLGNRTIGSQILNLHFNLHEKNHLFRAALEGVAFSFVYGVNLMNELGIEVDSIKVGDDNLFQSSVFSKTIASILDIPIWVVHSSGAVGAAKASSQYKSGNDLEKIVEGLEVVKVYQPDTQKAAYDEAYGLWKMDLEKVTL